MIINLKLKFKTITAILFVLALLIISSVSVQAFGNARNQEPMEMEVSYGMKGMVRPDRSFPLNIKLTNQGMDFKGTITIKTAAQKHVNTAMVYVMDSLLPASYEENYSQVITREIPVVMKSGEIWRKSLYSLFRYNNGNFQITLKDSRGEVVKEENLVVDQAGVINAGYLVGVMSDNPEYSRLLSSYVWPFDLIMDTSSVRSTLLQPEELMVENLDTDMPDILIFADYSIDDLTVSQQLALKTWEERGGILIEGADTQNVLSLLEDSFVDADVNKVADRSAMGFRTYDYASYALMEMPIRDQPNVIVYGILLGIYALAAGPGLYLLLRKLHKRYYLWFSMMALSLGFVVLIGAYGSNTRIRAPFLTYMSVIEQGEESCRETVEFGMQAPYNSSFSLYVDPSYTLTPWSSENSYNPESYVDTSTFGQVNISYQEDQKKITVSNLPSFTMTKYSLNREQALENEEGISTNLQVFDGIANGTITNHTEYDIRNAVVLMPMTGIWIGEIPAGETIQVKDKQVDDREELLELKYFGEGEKEERKGEERFEENAWQSMYNMKNIARTSDSQVMGQIVNPDTSWQMDSGYEAYGYAYYFAPAKVDMVQGDRLYCPYVQQYRSDDSISYLPGLAFSYSYLYDQEYTATYHLNDILEGSRGDNLQIESLWFEQREHVGKYSLAYEGTIDFYNNKTQEFDQIEDWNRTFHSEELSKYLNEDNEITIRYIGTDKKKDDNKTYVMPNIQVIGKVGEDAEN
ncbi:MAG TPA: hypothetical protein IAC62_08860 [Candidatus Pelethocola excrementipullorum]|nr:hypothetical protein [Candidatus Pelethocola excrementipullorum]